jgi:hypothetical protein
VQNFFASCSLLLSTAAWSIYGESVGVPARTAFKGEKLWATASSPSFIGQFDCILFADRTKSAFDRIKLGFFLFEVIDIRYHDTQQYDKQKEYEVEGIHHFPYW